MLDILFGYGTLLDARHAAGERRTHESLLSPEKLFLLIDCPIIILWIMGMNPSSA